MKKNHRHNILHFGKVLTEKQVDEDEEEEKGVVRNMNYLMYGLI